MHEGYTGSVAATSKRDQPILSFRAMLRGLVGAAVVLGGVACLAGLIGGGSYWLLDLLNHFWFHALIYFVVGSVLLVLLGGRKTLVVSVALALLCAVKVGPMYVSPDTPASTGPTLTLLHFNVNTRGGDPARVADYLRQQDADLVFLQEVSQAWLDHLDGQIGDYELVIAEPQDNNFGIACYIRADSRITIHDATVSRMDASDFDLPALIIEASVSDDTGSRAVSILSLHTMPPVSGQSARLRDEQLANAAAWAAEVGDHAIVIGDLNATPWSAGMRRMMHAGGLHNSQAGFGRQTTWPAGLPAALGIPIDHCLHGPGWATIDRVVGPSCGSDHRAIAVTLRASE